MEVGWWKRGEHGQVGLQRWGTDCPAGRMVMLRSLDTVTAEVRDWVCVVHSCKLGGWKKAWHIVGAQE